MAGITGGKEMPPAVLDQIFTRTDGVPLFIEELTKALLESGILLERENRFELVGPLPLAIPATLHASLIARLDRVATVKEVSANRLGDRPRVPLRSDRCRRRAVGKEPAGRVTLRQRSIRHDALGAAVQLRR